MAMPSSGRSVDVKSWPRISMRREPAGIGEVAKRPRPFSDVKRMYSAAFMQYHGISRQRRSPLIPIHLALKRPFNLDANILRLLLIELRELGPKLFEVQAGDFFVEFLGQQE